MRLFGGFGEDPDGNISSLDAIKPLRCRAFFDIFVQAGGGGEFGTTSNNNLEREPCSKAPASTSEMNTTGIRVSLLHLYR
jgi:hypothetical protein